MTDAIKAALESLFAEIVAFITAIFNKEVPEFKDLVK